ncbi:MAG: NADH-quinone oxidoreductase subunit J [Acidobacteriota bacterium]|nr:NADH-quinone oxidoreductase subunit J [Acidobacteriota bacterium]
MTPVATPFFFYLISGIAIVSALVMITKVNPVHSALALIVTLLASAGLYLMLYAPFMAGVQIVLYAGGILVMFLFVMMLVNIEHLYVEKKWNRQSLLALLGALSLSGLVITALVRGAHTLPQHTIALEESTNTQGIGRLLYSATEGYYVFAFEVASVLLLVAVVGAVVMAKRRV